MAATNKHLSNPHNNNVRLSLATSSPMITTSSSSTSTTTTTDGDAPPILRGVIFDMDGTLTKPNLDFAEMYRRCGVDPSQDILACVAQMTDEVERNRVTAIIEEMEEEGRQTMELLPGAKELISWFQAHDIPMALVTRNTYSTTAVLSSQLDGYTFAPLIARDDDRYPPKPHPQALQAIAQEWQVSLPSESLLMVGDSFTNDVMFGKNAGVRTALLVHQDHESPENGEQEEKDCTIPKEKQQQQSSSQVSSSSVASSSSPDFVTSTLWELAFQVYQNYRLPSPLGQPTLSKAFPPPQPTTDLAKAAARGDLETLQKLLLLLERQQQRNEGEEKEDEGSDGTRTCINQIDPDNANTALIWAVEFQQTTVVNYLLRKYATTIHVNHRGYRGNTALARAARHGHGPILELLLDCNHSQQGGINVNIPNEKLQYPLHVAAFQQHVHVVQRLLEAGANPLVLDRKGRTPSQDTKDPTIRLLLEAAEKETLLQR